MWQEASYLPIDPLAGFPRVELLGLFSTREGIIAQIAMAVLLVISFT